MFERADATTGKDKLDKLLADIQDQVLKGGKTLDEEDPAEVRKKRESRLLANSQKVQEAENRRRL